MRHKYTLLAAIFGTVVLADQGTKYWAVSRLTSAFEHAGLRTPGERLRGFANLKNLDNDPPEPGGLDLRRPAVPFVPGFWSHRYVENPGAAWGLLGNASATFRVPFFHVISIAAITIILAFYRRLEAGQRLTAVALSLVLGGAMGNYTDRLLRGYVIDFLDWHWRDRPGFHWPTFNVADAAICVGVLLMFAETLFVKRLPAAAPVAPPSPSPSPTTPLDGASTPQS